ncbi:transmembrane protease serine 9-like [Plodia interpunctella]|uniref:transmembrane protease serine 9-like n=1 Tax=Plodia interpunctella TaxID=58824 RepID=UPI003100FA9C
MRKFQYIALLLRLLFGMGNSARDLSNHRAWGLLHQFECGDSAADRIIGGANASLGQFPWIARLAYSYPDSSIDWLCGGAIVTDRYVLTAAHCIGTPEDEHKLEYVRLGEHDVRTDPDCVLDVCAPKVQDVKVKRTIIHPQFNNPEFHNDLAIIELEKPVKLNNYVAPICLPSTPEQTSTLKLGEMVTVAGWGKTNITTQERAKILQTVKIPVLEKKKCSTFGASFTMGDNEICAGAQLNKDACAGDSGGPLMKTFDTVEGPKNFLIGVVSFGPVLCGSVNPGVYTNLAQFMGWILDTIKSFSKRIIFIIIKIYKAYIAYTVVYTMKNPLIQKNILPDIITCGPLSEEDRIVGGDVAALDEFPWLVRIKYGLKNGKEVFACAGSLITSRYIVTAAHCVVNNLTITSVRLGEINDEDDCRRVPCQPADVQVDKVIPFPRYNSESLYRNDIALLRLEKDVDFTDYIRPVCLPISETAAKQDYVPDSVYWTAGWGQTESEKKSSLKRKVALEAVSMTHCQTVENISSEAASYVICAGGKPGKDSCNGDSGGSLVKQIHDNTSANWFLFGITSYGYKECGTRGRPGLYTRVTRYMDWILHNIASNT